MTSLSSTQYRGLNRLGDVVIPGTDTLPSFSASKAAEGIDRMLSYMNKSDRDSFLILATACGVLPKFAVRGIVAMAASHAKLPEPLAMVMRLATLGIKGVVHSLYWSDLGYAGTGPESSIHALIGYDAKMNTTAYEQSLTKETK